MLSQIQGPRLLVSKEVRWRAASVYGRACARLGQMPCQDIVADLCEHGAMVVDLQLCGPGIEAICLCLREAPVGIHQLVLYSGDHFFGADAQYRATLRAMRQRANGPPINEDTLRNLMAAISVFCSIRGGSLAVLELTGLPLIRQVPTLIGPLAQTLADLPMLQRLDLAGCGLQDRGLATLLPHLARALPKLSRLSLARNGLRDIRLIGHLLQGRAKLQSRRQAVPLGVLDLSANPSLSAGRQGGRSCGRPSRPPGRSSSRGSQRTAGKLRAGCARAPGRRRESGEAMRPSLVRVICEALRQGLLLRTLRLRFMTLSREDARPLLELLRHEIARRQHGDGNHESEFPLVEVSLEGNPLVEPEYHAAIAHGLRQLAIFQLGADLTARPGGLAGSELLPPPTRVRPDFPLWRIPAMLRPTRRQAEPGFLPGGLASGRSSAAGAQASGMTHGMSQGSRGSSKSLPPQPVEDGRRDDGQGMERNAVSEGDADSDQEPDLFDHRGRYDMKHQFQEELDALAMRLSPFSLHQRRPSAPPAGMRRRHGPGSAAQAARTAATTSASSGDASSRGGNIPVSATPAGFDRAYVPDRGLECGFGPPPHAHVFQAPHLDLSDTDSEASAILRLSAAAARRGLAGGVSSEGDEERPEPLWADTLQAIAERQVQSAARQSGGSAGAGRGSGRSPRPAWATGAILSAAAEIDGELEQEAGSSPLARGEADLHERLDAVTERLREGSINPGLALRYTLDRISSDVSSTAIDQGQEPPPPSSNLPQVDLEEVLAGPLSQNVVDLELLNLPGADLDASEENGLPLEAATSEQPEPIRRPHSA